MRFMSDIKYIKGADNVVAYALSRRADLAALTVSTLSSTLLQDVKLACVEDPVAIRLLAQGTLVDRDGLLYTSDTNNLYVPDQHRDKVLLECHCTPFSGHLGYKSRFAGISGGIH